MAPFTENSSLRVPGPVEAPESEFWSSKTSQHRTRTTRRRRWQEMQGE